MKYENNFSKENIVWTDFGLRKKYNEIIIVCCFEKDL